MKDWVINLTVVLADGSIIKTKRRPRYGIHTVALFWRDLSLPGPEGVTESLQQDII